MKLATLPTGLNPAALIVELLFADEIECWASPAMVEEYVEVLNDEPELLTRFLDALQLCHPLTELAVIRHKPDNRFLECALAVDADCIVTVNTARGHFDRKQYQTVRVVTPGEFLKLDEVQRMGKRFAG
ncbi:MAG: PIN domain-containing protein [Verrucomicrobia bacterium]|nr:PIN domain-containing protein [Verrucomicrobiota bacterium]